MNEVTVGQEQYLKKTNWNYLILELVLILLCSYLLLVGGTKVDMLIPAVLLINAVIISLVALFLIFNGGSGLGIETPLAGMLAVVLLASFTSIDPRRSFGEAGLVAIPVCLFYFISRLVSRGVPRELVVKVLLVVGSVFFVLGWKEAGGWYIGWLNANPGQWLPSAAFRLNNPNILAMLLNVWLMLAAARLLMSRPGKNRIILGAYVLSCLGLIYLTSSRGGWMGTAAGLACLAFFYFHKWRDRWLPQLVRLKKNRFFIAGAAAVIILGLSAGGYLLFRQLSHPTHGTRTEFWTPAWNAFLNSPLLGKGPFTFISAYMQYNSVPPGAPFDYAHSIYMDLLSGTGILGLLAFLWLMVAVVRKMIKMIERSEGLDWSVAAGALAALATFLVHGFVDSTHASEPISLWNLCIACGAALAVSPGGASKQNAVQKLFIVALALITAGYAWFNWWSFLPMHAGVEKADAGDWGAASLDFTEAVRRDPGMAAACQQAGLAESFLADQGQTSALQRAIAYYESTVRIDPYWGLNQANLGALYENAGRLEDARAAFSKAAAAAPRSEIFALNLGKVQEVLGDLSDAEESYRRVFVDNPDWTEAHFWRENAFRMKTLANWKATQLEKGEKSIADLEKAAKANPDEVRPYLALIGAYLEAGRIDEARDALQRSDFAVAGNNLQRIEQAWLKAEIQAAEGDDASAAETGETILDAYMQYGVFGPVTPGNEIYINYMFRRPAAREELAPQLEIIRWPDKWGRRALTLAGWLEKTGDAAGAEKWRLLVSENIPDLAAQ